MCSCNGGPKYNPAVAAAAQAARLARVPRMAKRLAVPAPPPVPTVQSDQNAATIRYNRGIGYKLPKQPV